jgi:hypothetical protein
MNAPFRPPPRPLRPEEAEVVKVFRDALQIIREDEISRMRDIIRVLEFLRDGLARLRRDLPDLMR